MGGGGKGSGGSLSAYLIGTSVLISNRARRDIGYVNVGMVIGIQGGFVARRRSSLGPTLFDVCSGMKCDRTVGHQIQA